MKFLCDRCKTKYSIADEKVRRKILKIRCKNCSNIITVRDPDSRPEQPAVGGGGVLGAAGAAGAARKPVATGSSLGDAFEHVLSGQMDDSAAISSDLPEFRPEAIDDEWYVGIDGQQQGPLPFVELAALVERGTAREDAYVWRDGFEDWHRADMVPELRPTFKKRKGTVPPIAKAAPRREVPRPTDGKLTDRSGPLPTARQSPLKARQERALAAPAASAAAKKAPAPKKGSPLDRFSPEFEAPSEGDSLPDLSDELVEDPSRPGLPAIPASVTPTPTPASLFAAASPAAAGTGGDSGSGQIDLAFTEPSRIVKLDALLAVGVGAGRTSNATGRVFQLPGIDDGSAEVFAAAASADAMEVPPIKPAGAVGDHAPVLQPLVPHREHRLYKMLAIGGGLATLMLIVVVLVMLPRGGTRTIIVEKEKSPEDIGAEIAEQIAREDAAKKFGSVTKTTQDSIPPARTPIRRGAPAPLPPKGKTVAAAGKSEDRLGQL